MCLTPRSVVTVPLSELDRPSAGRYDHLTRVYVPPVPEAQRRPDFHGSGASHRPAARAGRLPVGPGADVRLPQAVRAGGSYEVLEAIDSGDPDRLCDELGDLLLQVVLQAQLGQRGRATSTSGT